MYIFVILLALLTSALWLLPKYKNNAQRDVTALKSSGTGCLSVILLIIVLGLIVSVLQPPALMILLVLIAFMLTPVIALLFSSFLAVKLHARLQGEGKPPSMRAALYFLCFVLIGLLFWSGETFFRMRNYRECWRMEFTEKNAPVKFATLEQRVVNPLFLQFSARFSTIRADGTVRTLLMPDSFNGTRLINLYHLPGVKGKSPEMILFADALSVAAVDPEKMELVAIKREKGKVYLEGKNEITSWDVFNRVKYIGALRGSKFVPPEVAKELPLKPMYE